MVVSPVKAILFEQIPMESDLCISELHSWNLMQCGDESRDKRL